MTDIEEWKGRETSLNEGRYKSDSKGDMKAE